MDLNYERVENEARCHALRKMIALIIRVFIIERVCNAIHLESLININAYCPLLSFFIYMHRHAQIDLRIIDNDFGVVVTILMFISQKLYFESVY